MVFMLALNGIVGNSTPGVRQIVRRRRIEDLGLGAYRCAVAHIWDFFVTRGYNAPLETVIWHLNRLQSTTADFFLYQPIPAQHTSTGFPSTKVRRHRRRHGDGQLQQGTLDQRDGLHDCGAAGCGATHGWPRTLRVRSRCKQRCWHRGKRLRLRLRRLGRRNPDRLGGWRVQLTGGTAGDTRHAEHGIDGGRLSHPRTARAGPVHMDRRRFWPVYQLRAQRRPAASSLFQLLVHPDRRPRCRPDLAWGQSGLTL